MIPVPRQFRLWGAVGALFAALFALWMFFFPSLIPSHFAWVVEPRLAQAFIGAGYVFRTFFFLLFVFEKDWRKLRWTPWGNLVFTATLLLATIWHAEEVNWRFLVAHLWVILYTLEPVSMFFLIPRGAAAKGEPLTTGGPLGTWLRRLLIFEVAALGLFGLFLVVSPSGSIYAGRGRSRSSTPGSSPRGSWAGRYGPGRWRWRPIGTRFGEASSSTSSSGPPCALRSSPSGPSSTSHACRRCSTR